MKYYVISPKMKRSNVSDKGLTDSFYLLTKRIAFIYISVFTRPLTMAAFKLIVKVLLIACIQGTFSLSPTEAPPVIVVDPTPSTLQGIDEPTSEVANPLPACGANEEYSVCGNLCEDTCNNRCDAPVYQSFWALASTNPNCMAGCYCSPGFLRDLNGNCVLNTPNACGSGEFILSSWY
jgi:Trypsin Inhibitor like cysteine rich domain